MDGVVGADQEIGANRFQLAGGGEHQFAHARPVAAVDIGHVVGQRGGVHRDLGVRMRAEDRCALDADRAVAQRFAFRRAGDDADMSRCHDDVRRVNDKCRTRQYCTPSERPQTGALLPSRALLRNWRGWPIAVIRRVG